MQKSIQHEGYLRVHLSKKERKRLTKKLRKSDIGIRRCSQESDATHSKFCVHFFYSSIFSFSVSHET